MVTTKAVKTTALIHLRGNWANACTVAMIPVFATVVVVLMGYLFSLPFGAVVANIIAVTVFLLICAPLWLGALRVYWRMANGCFDGATETFYYMSGKKEYLRCLLFNLKVVVHWLAVGLLLFLPCIITGVFTSEEFYRSVGISMPLVVHNLKYLVNVFKIAAIVLTAVHLIALYLPAFLFVSNEYAEPGQCIKRGLDVGRYTKGRFAGHIPGFLCWILLSLTFIPLIFTVPYLLMSYVVACRYSVAYYNLSGQAASDAPMHEV